MKKQKQQLQERQQIQKGKIDQILKDNNIDLKIIGKGDEKKQEEDESKHKSEKPEIRRQRATQKQEEQPVVQEPKPDEPSK